MSARVIHWAGMFLLVVICMGPIAGAADSEEEMINYDESKVVPYTLPNPLVTESGQPVDSAQRWQQERRGELLQLFRKHVYGQPLPQGERWQFRPIDIQDQMLQGKATRKRVRLELVRGDGIFPVLTVTLWLPNGKQAVPAFVGMHLFESASDTPVPGKPLEQRVDRELPGPRLMEVILNRGYAVATLDAQEFCPDDKKRFREGALAVFQPNRQGYPGPEEGGAISTWAWGLSRALDYLQSDPAIDGQRVAVIGHSRMGKTALWAGAQDERFALVISNNSGCGGAALSRRNFGETVARINTVFPHWFCGNFSQYNRRESTLPVDQHELISLIAPRPVYVASAEDDRWADPRGEFLAAVGADSVYRLLGKNGIDATQPPIGKSVGETIGYHVRVGKHALADYDWLHYLDFADRHFGRGQAAP